MAISETALLNLYCGYKRYEVGLLDGDLEGLAQLAHKFETVLKKESDAAKGVLGEVHYDIIVRLKFAFKELGKKDSAFIGFHDRIFVNVLKVAAAPSMVTKLFEEFIKGITYFRQQIDPRHPFPVYHRLHSCGPNLYGAQMDEEYRGAHLTCPGGLPRSEKNRRKTLIERCYLERLIYDELYRHFALHHPARGNAEPEQDLAHTTRLRLVESDYRSCFRDGRIEIAIRYESNYPTHLEVRRYKKDALVSTEVYVKTLGDLSNRFVVYEPGVYCHRLISKDSVAFAKVNVFDMEQDWKRTGAFKMPVVTDAH